MITDEIKKYRVFDEIRRNQFGTIIFFGLFKLADRMRSMRNKASKNRYY